MPPPAKAMQLSVTELSRVAQPRQGDTQPVQGVLGAPASLHITETSHITCMRTDKNTRQRSVWCEKPLSGFPGYFDRLPKKMLTIPTPKILLKEKPWKERREGRREGKEGRKEGKKEGREGGKEGGRGRKEENCTLKLINWIARGKQPHSTGRSARCFVTT